ncbi:MAG: hypothetical protein ACREEH_08570, partial [Caulobacteraceae bacterium]
MQPSDGGEGLDGISPEPASFIEAPAPAAIWSGDIQEAAGALDVGELISALNAVRAGDFTVRLSGERSGAAGRVAEAFNDIVSANA